MKKSLASNHLTQSSKAARPQTESNSDFTRSTTVCSSFATVCYSTTTAPAAQGMGERLKEAMASSWYSTFLGHLQLLQSLGVWACLLMLCLLLQPAAYAAGIMPYEEWLSVLQDSLTGPVAFSVSLIGIVTCGATLILAGGEISQFMRSLIYIVMVMTLLVGANSLMHNLFEGTPSASANIMNESQQTMPGTAVPSLTPLDGSISDSIGADPLLQSNNSQFALAALEDSTALSGEGVLTLASASTSAPVSSKLPASTDSVFNSVFNPLPTQGSGDTLTVSDGSMNGVELFIEIDPFALELLCEYGYIPPSIMIKRTQQHPTYDPENEPAPDPNALSAKGKGNGKSESDEAWDRLDDRAHDLFRWHYYLEHIKYTQPSVQDNASLALTGKIIPGSSYHCSSTQLA